MSLNGKGWRQGAPTFLGGIQDADALATALQNGTLSIADFAKLAALPALGTLVAFYSSAQSLIATGGPFTIPVVDIGGGKLFHVVAQRVDVITAVGTATGTLTVQFTKNGVNVGTAGSANAAAMNGSPAPVNFNLSSLGPVIDPSVANTLQATVTAAYGGLSSATGKFGVFGYYE
jgi:hypothetical protein